MTPDNRIFDRILPLLPTASIIPWIEPCTHEPIVKYAERLAATIENVDKPIICGVSFGGIVARELALQCKAKACVLISSIRDHTQLPPSLSIFRPLAGRYCDLILGTIGKLANAYPRSIRNQTTVKLSKFAGDRGSWYRWATNSVLAWKADPKLDTIPLLQIHGDCDATIPIRYISPDIVIAGGGHLLPMTHGNEIAGMLAEVACRSSR